MKILVFIKQVPEADGIRLDPKTGALNRDNVPSMMNPYDAHAVEAALQLKELHGVLLEILDDVHSICTEHGLRYVLIGGSAIGALRSGGIIPWDDDIDIAMPRGDFEKFTAIVREKWDDKYSMLHPQGIFHANINIFTRYFDIYLSFSIRIKYFVFQT